MDVDRKMQEEGGKYLAESRRKKTYNIGVRAETGGEKRMPQFREGVENQAPREGGKHRLEGLGWRGE